MALFSRRQERDTDTVASDTPSLGGAGRAGPVSRPVPTVTGPTPVIELSDSLLHTATPRYIGVIGVAATFVFVVAVTVASSTSSSAYLVVNSWSISTDGLRDMRPLLTGALLVTLGVAAFGCLWWSTFATINGRRVTRGRTLGPLLPAFVYVSIAVAYLAINSTVHGDGRVWAWVCWSLATFAAHAFVIMAFKSSAETIGNPTTHFTQVAAIPVAMAAAVAMGIAFRVLLGIPFLAVPVLMAWMVLELYRAMHGWDRACAQRMKVMLRDFSYDTPSGSVPVVAPPTTGQTPATGPRRTQVMQVTTTDPPERVAGTHHPVRPTWNPVEEARRKAELQAAAAMGVAGADAAGPSALDAFIGQQAPRRVQVQRRRHHTLIPKLMLSFGPVAWLLGLPVTWLLTASDHLTLVDREFRYDDVGRTVQVFMLAFYVSCTFVGWLWWTTSSLANVRQRNQNAPWPGIVAASYWATLAGVALVLVGNRADLMPVILFGALIAGVAWLYTYFGVISSLRTAAGIIGAPKVPWTSLLKIPFLIIATSALTFVLTAVTGSRVVAGLGMVITLGLYVWETVAFYRGVWSFDRVCKAPPPPKVEEAQMPLFLRQAMGARMS